MEVFVLGRLRVRDADGEREVPPGFQRTLLALLAVRAREAVPADRLADALWGESPPALPANALQARVSQLRKALGPAGRDRVRAVPGGYLLDVPDDAVDARRATALVEDGRRLLADGRPDVAVARLGEALDLFRGEPLEEFADQPWAVAEATRLAELRAAAEERLVEAELARGHHHEVLPRLEAATVRWPLRERLRALHMTALYRAGRQADALAVYEHTRALLDEELGIDPGAELRAVHVQVLRQDPALGPAAPGTGTGPALGRLPRPTTTLVGAERAVARVADLIRRTRLTTLTGPGGVGKTRLAVEAAHAARASFPDGAALVELAATASGTDLDRVVLEALGVPDGLRQPGVPQQAVRGRLLSALSDRAALLVLDNAEHLLDDLAPLVTDVLRRTADVHVLVTSREPLGVSDETTWSVPSLPVPPADATSEVALASPSVRLVLDRAEAAAAGFTAAPDDVPHLVQVVRRLDGIPLALEIAAARVRHMSLAELAAGLDDRFSVLTRPGRDLLPRQRTLQALLDWSWDLLDDDLRHAWTRCAAFAGAFTRADAARMCGPGSDALLEGLTDRSLLAADTRGRATRYSMLETVREYGRLRAERSGTARAVDRAHAAWVLARLDEQRPTDPWHWTLDLEEQTGLLDDARAAMSRAHAAGDAATVTAVAAGLGWTWWLRGLGAEARGWFAAGVAPTGQAALWAGFLGAVEGTRGSLDPAALLATAAQDDDALTAGLAYVWSGLLQGATGDHDAARASLDRADARLAPLGGWATACADVVRGLVEMSAGRGMAAERTFERARVIAAATGAWWAEIHATDGLAGLAEMRGDYATAVTMRSASLAHASEHGVPERVAVDHVLLGNLEVLRGDLAAAAEHHRAGSAAARRIGSDAARALAHNGRGFAARRACDFATAAAEHTWALEIYERLGSAGGAAFSLAGLGFVAEQRGDADAARRSHGQGLMAARRTGDPRAVALALEGLAGAHAVAGRPRAARALLDAAARRRRSAGAPLPPAERHDVDRIEAAIAGAGGAAAPPSP